MFGIVFSIFLNFCLGLCFTMLTIFEVSALLYDVILLGFCTYNGMYGGERPMAIFCYQLDVRGGGSSVQKLRVRVTQCPHQYKLIGCHGMNSMTLI